MQHGRHGGAGATATQQRPAGGGGGASRPRMQAHAEARKHSLPAHPPPAFSTLPITLLHPLLLRSARETLPQRGRRRV